MSQHAELIERLRDADNNSVQRASGSRIFGEAADALSLIEAERDKLDGFAQHWHGEIQAIGVLLGIGEPDAGEAPKAVQALVAERDKLREALKPFGQILVYTVDDDPNSILVTYDGQVLANLSLDSAKGTAALKLEQHLAVARAALHPTDNDHGDGK